MGILCATVYGDRRYNDVQSLDHPPSKHHLVPVHLLERLPWIPHTAHRQVAWEFLRMPTLSNEAIITIVTLVTTCPPSVALIWNFIRRRRRAQQAIQNGEFKSPTSLALPVTDVVPVAGVELHSLPHQVFVNQVNLLVPRPGLVHLSKRG
jgi:hypothetical protein